ncbi:D-alanyl-D-alanine carboxypeptidase/D-alanyl-D-alanine-endopeptidase [Psychromonas antarctica]|uniref:D-alanyl-D-alanine carboxypeptidase/D-alanyl-D-alanine endopeptidase n=1 Tax=Psychromonas antarctica TaxID=67573 RepID=UPI001EE87695|nr:D-alanyl-D-alanine carboxypeptidase/D-alanyl-D-alanine-endopeptidase [Psychromonas antarctica]MCG6201458.1 D-alanyl-D-alanine carboxypeptidase/D-alanyl-D-alanine-endopeptidase [Psychromonas antarctica]
MSKCFFCFIIFILPVNLFASDWLALHPLLPKGTQISYMVVDPAQNKVITQYQQSLLRTPASMQKLLTATAAKLYLGSQFRYQTTIEGEKSNINKQRYQGDLIMRFVGDPTLLRSDISGMLKSLKQLGIKYIAGDFLLNQSHFSGYQWSNGQAWNDLGVCYTAPSNAIIVNKNCVLGNLSLSHPKAKKATLFIPGYEPVDISSDVSVVTKAQRSAQFCELEVTRNSHNQYSLWGCMVPRERPFALAFAVNDPFAYARQIIASELMKVGIILEGEIKLDSNNTSSVGDVLIRHQSPPLDEMLRIMVKESDNLIADSLFKTLGAAYFRTAGNFRNGGQAVKLILKEQGIDLENAYLADGSGLSRHNLMSAVLFMTVLEYVYHNDSRLNLLSSFSVAGIDGTLKYHQGVRGKLLKGKIIAKTGSMQGVANLLGVVKRDHGDRLFVLILNGYNLAETALSEHKEKDKKISKYHFEQAFFEAIIKPD